MEGHAGECAFAWALLLSLLSQVGCQLCAGPCNCPSLVPLCPEGVPLVMDGCLCCQMCARQKGDACDDKSVCDAQRGLQCDYSASYPGGPGECVRQDELGCEVNGVMYRDGQKFQLGCTGMCRCHGGGVACVSLCPPNIRLPSPDCPYPREVQRPGQCCKEWVCEDMDNTIHEDALTAHRPWPGVSGQNQNQIQTQNPNQNQIQIQRPNQNWIQRPNQNQIQNPNPNQIQRPNQNQKQISASNCIQQNTEWSACSPSCGSGVSVRVSNRNRACRLERQMRFCQVRPCQDIQSTPRMGGGRCKASYRPALPGRLRHGGCLSARPYRPRYCGLCSDGRCCAPYRTRTVTAAFICPAPGGGGAWARYRLLPIMAIDSCVCRHHICPGSPPQ